MEYNIKIDHTETRYGDVDWILLSQNRVQQLGLVNMKMELQNFRVTIRREIYALSDGV